MSDTIQTKKCSKCKQFKPFNNFYKRSQSKDSRQCVCIECRKEWFKSDIGKKSLSKYNRSYKHKAVYKKHAQTPKGKLSHCKQRKVYAARHPYKILAQRVVQLAIKAKKLPAANTLTCSCTKQAEHYHHNMGYALEHRLDVIPVCLACHNIIHRS